MNVGINECKFEEKVNYLGNLHIICIRPHCQSHAGGILTLIHLYTIRTNIFDALNDTLPPPHLNNAGVGGPAEVPPAKIPFIIS